MRFFLVLALLVAAAGVQSPPAGVFATPAGKLERNETQAAEEKALLMEQQLKSDPNSLLMKTLTSEYAPSEIEPAKKKDGFWGHMKGKVSQTFNTLFRERVAPRIGYFVVNRESGKKEFEYMPKLVRSMLMTTYATPLLAKTSAFRRALRYATIKRAETMDKAGSTKDIPGFIKDYSINMTEYVLTADKYPTFNEFFYREINLDYRKLENATDSQERVSSSADCRLITFHSVKDAKDIWIKGRFFTPATMIYSSKDLIEKDSNFQRDFNNKYANASLAVFRLAPQDYHRFHLPIDGTVEAIRDISGDYLTVNPVAVNSKLDVFSENRRVVVEVRARNGKLVYLVCVGATMVGSVVLSVKEKDVVHRGQELGYFAFGGSTVVMLGHDIQFDDDIDHNSRSGIETLVKARSTIGRYRSTDVDDDEGDDDDDDEDEDDD